MRLTLGVHLVRILLLPNKRTMLNPFRPFKSGPTWEEKAAEIANLSLEDKRKSYKCRGKYVTLSRIESWQEMSSRSDTGSATSKYEVNPDMNGRVSFCKEDITSLEIDCIANAANELLLGGGGVDGAIHSAAGRYLMSECETLGPKKAGEAAISNGYLLPAKRVVHTVGPRYESREKLASCYRTTLELVRKENLKSVAFPCISTGIFGYPNHKAAEVALQVVREWMEEQGTELKIERVIFCLFLEVDVRCYMKLLPKYFPVSGGRAGTEDPSIPVSVGSTSTGDPPSPTSNSGLPTDSKKSPPAKVHRPNASKETFQSIRSLGCCGERGSSSGSEKGGRTSAPGAGQGPAVASQTGSSVPGRARGRGRGRGSGQTKAKAGESGGKPGVQGKPTAEGARSVGPGLQCSPDGTGSGEKRSGQSCGRGRGTGSGQIKPKAGESGGKPGVQGKPTAEGARSVGPGLQRFLDGTGSGEKRSGQPCEDVGSVRETRIDYVLGEQTCDGGRCKQQTKLQTEQQTKPQTKPQTEQQTKSQTKPQTEQQTKPQTEKQTEQQTKQQTKNVVDGRGKEQDAHSKNTNSEATSPRACTFGGDSEEKLAAEKMEPNSGEENCENQQTGTTKGDEGISVESSETSPPRKLSEKTPAKMSSTDLDSSDRKGVQKIAGISNSAEVQISVMGEMDEKMEEKTEKSVEQEKEKERKGEEESKREKERGTEDRNEREKEEQMMDTSEDNQY